MELFFGLAVQNYKNCYWRKVCAQIYPGNSVEIESKTENNGTITVLRVSLQSNLAPPIMICKLTYKKS